MLYAKFGSDRFIGSRETAKCLQPTNDDGQKRIAMGHVGDSGELKSN